MNCRVCCRCTCADDADRLPSQYGAETGVHLQCGEGFTGEGLSSRGWGVGVVEEEFFSELEEGWSTGGFSGYVEVWMVMKGSLGCVGMVLG